MHHNTSIRLSSSLLRCAIIVLIMAVLVLSFASCNNMPAELETMYTTTPSTPIPTPSPSPTTVPTATPNPTATPVIYTITLDNDNGYSGNTYNVYYGDDMPDAPVPTREGFNFLGYYSEKDGKGVRYYNSEMHGVRTWNMKKDATLYAYWELKPSSKYSSSSSVGQQVYIDINSIYITSGLYNSAFFQFHHYLCTGTSNGQSYVRLYIDAALYREKFDENAPTNSLSPLFASTIYKNARIYGIVISGESINAGEDTNLSGNYIKVIFVELL